MMDALARARTLGVIVDRMTALAAAVERPGRIGRRKPPTPKSIVASNGNGKHDTRDAQAASGSRRGSPAPSIGSA